MVNKQKILIVDDDENIAELISLYLTKECFDTLMVHDGEKALIAFDTYQPDLILLDLIFAGNRRLSGLPGDPCKIQRAHHHALRQRRGL